MKKPHWAIIAGVLLLLALLACGGKKECRATLSYKGVTGPGTGKGKAEALMGACWGYCGKHDPDVDQGWKRWRKQNGKPETAPESIKIADLHDDDGLKRILDACTAQCQSEVAAGKGSVSYASHCK